MKPERIFTFGCSFTRYLWSGWPEILAYELDAPLYNYGFAAACNQLIFSAVVQANAFHKFGPSDLVIVEWTSISRKSIFMDGSWRLSADFSEKQGGFWKFLLGNTYRDKILELEYDPVGFTIRDLTSIDAAQRLLQQSGCSWYNFQMIDLVGFITDELIRNKVSRLFGDSLSKIKPSFEDVLFNSDLNSAKNESRKIHPRYVDAHPMPVDHLRFLETIGEFPLSEETRIAVKAYDELVRLSIRLWIKDNAENTSGDFNAISMYPLNCGSANGFPKNAQPLNKDELFLMTKFYAPLNNS